MDRQLADEAAATLASARALLTELSEEGVEHAPSPERGDEPPAAVACEAPADLPDRNTAGAAPAPLAAPQAPLDWGPTPTLAEVRARLGDCRRCGLAAGRTQIVFGDGNPDADLMFVGEGPGREEDRQGLPFVGRAGELLTQMIENGLGIPRRDVYICNIVKCRPPNNRTPLGDEVSACRPFLDGQIAAVRPRVIVALGKPAASLLLGRDIAITRVRGTWHTYTGIPVMPTFHPAYVLRQYTPENRRAVWEDLKAALARSREASR